MPRELITIYLNHCFFLLLIILNTSFRSVENDEKMLGKQFTNRQAS